MAQLLRLCACLALAGVLSGCEDAGLSVRSQPAAPVPTAVASPAAVATPPATVGPLLAAVVSTSAPSQPAASPIVATAVATRPPEPTAIPVTVHIGNTSGQPVYLYNSPTIGDRIQAYPEGTPLLVIGGDVEGDGLIWHFVHAPDGTEGYVPVNDTPPSDAASP